MSPSELAQGMMDLLYSKPYVVVGNSMLPTLANQQPIQAVTLRFSWNQIRRSDIVIFQHPYRGGTSIKRVVGLPGEYIQISPEGVRLNNCPFPEPYLPTLAGTDKGKASRWIVDSDEYFVLGDNRADSEDSRDFGPVNRKQILGRVWFRYWPIHIFHAGMKLPNHPGNLRTS